jgi:hypothetical protein
MKENRPWTPDELTQVRREYPTAESVALFAASLDRTQGSVRQKAHDLGVKRTRLAKVKSAVRGAKRPLSRPRRPAKAPAGGGRRAAV